MTKRRLRKAFGKTELKQVIYRRDSEKGPGDYQYSILILLNQY
jgi:hypothetical protein